MRGEQQVEAALKSYEDVDSWKTVNRYTYRL